jgi:hypothetical protein
MKTRMVFSFAFCNLHSAFCIGTYPFAVRHQYHGQAVPARQEAPQTHRPRAAVSVVGINEPDRVFTQIDQGDDVSANAAVQSGRVSRTRHRRSQLLLDGEAQDAPAATAGILDAITNAGFPQRRFQTARTARAGMRVGEAVNRFQAVMARQRFQGAPTAAARRPIRNPAGGRDVDLRVRRGTDEQAQNNGQGAKGSMHGKILFPRSDDRPVPSSMRNRVDGVERGAIHERGAIILEGSHSLQSRLTSNFTCVSLHDAHCPCNAAHSGATHATHTMLAAARQRAAKREKVETDTCRRRVRPYNAPWLEAERRLFPNGEPRFPLRLSSSIHAARMRCTQGTG